MVEHNKIKAKEERGHKRKNDWESEREQEAEEEWEKIL